MFCVSVELGDWGMCSLKVTSPNGKRSKILVSNPHSKQLIARSTASHDEVRKKGFFLGGGMSRVRFSRQI